MGWIGGAAWPLELPAPRCFRPDRYPVTVLEPDRLTGESAGAETARVWDRRLPGGAAGMFAHAHQMIQHDSGPCDNQPEGWP